MKRRKLTPREKRLVKAAVREFRAQEALERIVKVAGRWHYLDVTGTTGCKATSETRT